MKLTQLLSIVLATVAIGWAGRVTASQVKKPSSIKIIVKAPAEELELFYPLKENPELARHIAAVFNEKYEEEDWSICEVAAHLLKVKYENILGCFHQNTALEIDTLTKTQHEALQLLNAVVKDKNQTYSEYSIEAYESLYLAFHSSNIPTFDNLFCPIQKGLFQHYQNRFFKNNIFNFETFAQYLKENYTPQDVDVLAEFFVRKLQHRQKVFSFGGSREALEKCGPHLSRLSNFGIFEQERKAALEKEQQAAVQETENLKKQAAEKEKAASAEQGPAPAPKEAHVDHAPLNQSKPATTVETAQGQQEPEDALAKLEADGFKFPEATQPDNNLFARAKHFFRANRWTKYTAYVLMGVVVGAAAVYGFGKYRNACKLARAVGRWA